MAAILKNCKYALNPKTNKLHIVGYCHLTEHLSPDWKGYLTEDAAIAQGGRAIGMCKKCLAKRETILRQKGNY